MVRALAIACFLCAYFSSEAVDASGHSHKLMRKIADASIFMQTHAKMETNQSVHWVFTTDCSAYMFNQGNLMLASAYHVGQPGAFTWIMYGCDRDEQKTALKKLAHPRAKVWYAPQTELKDPTTGKTYRAFQASNRPQGIAAWWKDTKPTEDAIGILDPDMTWLRPVVLTERPSQVIGDAWGTKAAAPKHGSGARYGQGCIPARWSDVTMLQVCGQEEGQECVHAKQDYNSCSESYSSGPPWVLHRSDADDVYGTWTDTAVKVHESWPDMLSEQVSYGVAQMKFGVKSALNPFWFISAPDADEQPWQAVAKADYDPCATREPPPQNLNLPPLWHACSTYEIPHLRNQGYRLHKDHIHKDLLDCDAPLLRHPPLDALERYKVKKNSKDFRQTWSVCAYTNLVNFYASSWKGQYCEKPNLDRSFVYPSHAQSFLNSDSWMEKVFRKGGWTDVDYKIM